MDSSSTTTNINTKKKQFTSGFLGFIAYAVIITFGDLLLFERWAAEAKAAGDVGVGIMALAKAGLVYIVLLLGGLIVAQRIMRQQTMVRKGVTIGVAIAASSLLLLVMLIIP